MTRFVFTINKLWTKNDIENIIKNGIYDFRINAIRMGHEQIFNYRRIVSSLAQEYGVASKLFIDLPGSKSRIWNCPDEKKEIPVDTVFEIYLVETPHPDNRIQITGNEVFNSIKCGDVLEIRRVNYERMYLTVLKKDDNKVCVCAKTKIIIGWGYHILNRSNYHTLKEITLQDEGYITHMESPSSDIIGLSFADCPEIVKNLRDLLIELGNGGVKIFAKIETRFAVDRLNDIIDVADGIIIGRDDLLAYYSKTEVDELVNGIIIMCKEKNMPVVPASNYFLSLAYGREMRKEEHNEVLSLLLNEPDYVYINETNKNNDWRVFCNEVDLLYNELEVRS